MSLPPIRIKNGMAEIVVVDEEENVMFVWLNPAQMREFADELEKRPRLRGYSAIGWRMIHDLLEAPTEGGVQ